MNFLDLPKLPVIQYGKEEYPLFTRLSLETTKTCTRDCWFCPNSQRGPKVQTMTDKLYYKILNELEELGFNGVIQWFFLNEPLLDKDYLARIRALRKACPKSTIHLTTNWDIYWKRPQSVQIETIRNLFEAGVNSLNLNDYDCRGYLTTVVEAALAIGGVEIHDHNWKKLSPKKRVLSCGPLPEKLHTWTGYISEDQIEEDGRQHQSSYKHCPRPMRHIVVMYDGKVPLCCAANPNTTDSFGDVNNQSLVEVWNCKGLFKYRAKLQDGLREGICEGCDASVAYPWVVRRVAVK